MQTKFVLSLAIVLIGTACSRTPTLDTRTFPLHYISRGQAISILDPYVFTDRADAPGKISASEDAVTVRETPDNLDKIARVLAQFDRPAENVRLHFQIIQADGKAPPDSSIAAVVTQLRKLFRFDGYRLVTRAEVVGSDNSRSTQMLDGGNSIGPMELQVGIDHIRGAGDSTIVDLGVQLRSRRGNELGTSIGARVGQTVVLGGMHLAKVPGQLILTVRPELVTN